MDAFIGAKNTFCLCFPFMLFSFVPLIYFVLHPPFSVFPHGTSFSLLIIGIIFLHNSIFIYHSFSRHILIDKMNTYYAYWNRRRIHTHTNINEILYLYIHNTFSISLSVHKQTCLFFPCYNGVPEIREPVASAASTVLYIHHCTFCLVQLGFGKISYIRKIFPSWWNRYRPIWTVYLNIQIV